MARFDLIPFPGKNGRIIVLLAALIVLFFLVLGSAAFSVCVLIPPGRKYALSTALWFAVWGPCSVLLLFLAILGVVAGGFALQATQMHWEDASKFFSAIGWGASIVGVIVTSLIATVAAWLHQALIHRMTFLLFRLYVTFVVAGIGSVVGLVFFWLAMGSGRFHYTWWLVALIVPIMILAFGSQAYKHARALRGHAPTGLTWITPDEFAGPVEPQG
jgi:hypothetical protein